MRQLLRVGGCLLIGTLFWVNVDQACAQNIVADGFDYPIGVAPYYTQQNDGDGWYSAQDHGEWNEEFGKYHLGEDWNKETGTNTDCGLPAFAEASGTIVFAASGGSGWGNVIIVRSQLPSGILVELLYGHVASFSKTSGNVTRGDEIASIGDGGMEVPYCHLHFEVRYQNAAYWGSPGAGYSLTSQPPGWADPSDFMDANRFYANALVKVYGTSVGLLVRAPNACSTSIGTQADGSRGTVLGGGPIFCNGFSRYQIAWDDGTVGWSAQNWLKQVPVPPGTKDIVIQSVSASNTTPSPGDATTVSYTVVNQGTDTITATYREDVYLSTNTTLDGSDVLLGSSHNHTNDLPGGGGSHSRSAGVTIPSGTAGGAYYLLVQGDAGGSVAESNESNNVAAVPITVTPVTGPVTRYVATNGSDTGNDCTNAANRCATLAHAVSQANAGDTIDMAAGTYTLSMSLLIDKALNIQGQGVIVQ